MKQQKRQIVITPEVFDKEITFGAMVLWGHDNLIGVDPFHYPYVFIEYMGLPAEEIQELAQELIDNELDYWNR
jgi:hypothetical protein